MKAIHYALRALAHYKTYSLLNLLGLALSLACVVIIARYVHGEVTVDSHHAKIDRVFISTCEQSTEPGQLTFVGISNRNNEKNFIDLSTHPGVERHAPFYLFDDEEITVDERTRGARVLVVDTNFLEVLDYPLVAGAANLYRPDDVLLTEAFAAKLFGGEDPLGKSLYYPNLYRTLTVAGIIRRPAGKSVLSFDMLVSSAISQNWARMSQSLLLLHRGVDYREINRRYDQFMEMTAWGYDIRYQLFPYDKVYFDHHVIDHLGFARGNLSHVYILASVGVLLLFVGLVNYLNLHSVVLTRRRRELAMKSVFGAGRSIIFLQFFIEHLLLVAFSLLIAFGLASAARPVVDSLLDTPMTVSPRFDACLSIILLLALPSLASAVRVTRRATLACGTFASRRVYLFCQYFVTTLLIVVSLFFVKQLHYMLDADPGYRARDVIRVPFLKNSYTIYDRPDERQASLDKLRQAATALKAALDASPLVEHWCFGDFPIKETPASFAFNLPSGEPVNATLFSTDETWFKVFDISPLEGRLWDNAADTWASYNCITTGESLRRFGIASYRDGLLQPSRRLWYSSANAEEMKTNPPYRVVGVVKDIRVRHAAWQPEPVVFLFVTGRADEPVLASFDPANRQEIVALMKGLHDELLGGEFTYSFIEDELDALYRDDKRNATLCTLFAGIAILVSVTGLLGVSLFDIRQRRREIAIRKINGARVRDIARLIVGRYLALSLLAFIVSVPVALFILHRYLENFAYRAPVSWWLFLVAFAVTLLVTLLTLSCQVAAASRENPADILKTE